MATMKSILSLLGLLAMAVLGVWLLWWCRRAFLSLRKRPVTAEPEAPSAAPQKTSVARLDIALPAAAPEPKDVEFRMHGERGMGGPIYGDLLCLDGVYLPHVWEDDYAISFDGRWIRTGSYANEVSRLIDRKHRRSWLLTQQEAAAVLTERWRLPRWQDAEASAAAVTEDGQAVYSDEAFDAWLGLQVAHPAQEMVAILDLWVPPDSVPPEVQQLPPSLPPAPRDAAVKLSLQRYLPPSLRALRYPMDVLRRPAWQLHFNDEAQPWGVEQIPQLAWRPDGQALAIQGRRLSDGEDAALQLAIWSAAAGWQAWPLAVPEDRKPWSVQSEAAPDAPLLHWEGEALLQSMVLDTPELERLHDGRSISSTLGDVEGCSGHTRDGRVLVKTTPRTHFWWLRNLLKPEQWKARSVPVARQALEWTLSQASADVHGATTAYQLQWGEVKLPGAWELEHVVVRNRWAVLLPAGAVPRHGGVRYLQVWDGEQLQRVDVPGAVVRLRPVPQGDGKGGPRAQVMLLVGCVADAAVDAQAALWHWPVQVASPGPLGQIENSAVYEWRDIGPDEHGFWHVLPRWREVDRIQHPSADGDYVWRFAPGGDELWWWGGVHQDVNNLWSPELARMDGVCITSGGAVLCGVGPSALPQPEGKGWVAWELAARIHGEPHQWKLHWLQPDTREVRTLEVRAWLPLLLSWDGKGLQWREGRKPAGEEAASTNAPRHTIDNAAWNAAKVERLNEGPQGLWLRKQDMRYADVITDRKDWPWSR